MYQRILAPVDGSSASDRGFREAVALARDQNARLRVLHVVDEYALALDLSGTTDLGQMHETLKRYGEDVLDKAKRYAADQGVQAETVLRETVDRRVTGAVLAEAQSFNADLIVMGTHGRRGLSQLILGSDAEVVVRRSPVPVLLVRSGEAQ